MGMNNIYYRFTHLVHGDYAHDAGEAADERHGEARRGQGWISSSGRSPSRPSTAAAMCMESHEKVVLQHGMTKEMVQAAVRIAAVVHADRRDARRRGRPGGLIAGREDRRRALPPYGDLADPPREGFTLRALRALRRSSRLHPSFTCSRPLSGWTDRQQVDGRERA